jgi:hypothetical protein
VSTNEKTIGSFVEEPRSDDERRGNVIG